MKKGLLITLALGAAATLNAQEATKKINKLEAIDNGVKLNVSACAWRIRHNIYCRMRKTLWEVLPIVIQHLVEVVPI